MFMLTVKWNRKTAVLIILLAALLLITIIIGISHGSREPDAALGIQLNSCEKRIAYLASYGWQAVAESEVAQEIVIPREFNEVYTKYNELQLTQGFDLREYCGMDATVYTYAITNHPSGQEVYAQLILFSGQVIGGDIHSRTLDGFMHGLNTGLN